MHRQAGILETIFGPCRNRVKPLHGAGRMIAEAAMARSHARLFARDIRQDSPSVADVINLLDCNLAFGSGFKSKFVYFNARVYPDCFAPGWPGPAFDRMINTMFRNNGREFRHREHFLPALIFSTTKKCVYRCEHCYAIQTLGHKDVLSAAQILKIAMKFQDMGVGLIAWEGGEPLLVFDDILMLIRETRARSDQLLATTAYGLTPQRVALLAEAGLTQAIISLDHYEPDKHNAFRGNKKAFDMAVNGVRLFLQGGILPSVAICATRDIMEHDGLWKYLELAKQIGAAYVQILDATPSGNYIGKDVMLSHAQMQEIKKFHVAVNTDPRYRDYPGVQARAYLECGENFGCGAGESHCYVDSSGNVQSCVLLQIAFGNALQEDVRVICDRIKAHIPHPTAGRCPAQSLHKQIHKVYETRQSLPLPYEDCRQILETIQKRPLPEKYEQIHKKLKRRLPLDFLKRD